MANPSAPEGGERSLAELRSLHELARQLLPLATPHEVARDGLLCIAGITGIGSGALLWRQEGTGRLELLSHFGLGPARLRLRYRIPPEGLRSLEGSAPQSLEAVGRPAPGGGAPPAPPPPPGPPPRAPRPPPPRGAPPAGAP